MAKASWTTMECWRYRCRWQCWCDWTYRLFLWLVHHHFPFIMEWDVGGVKYTGLKIGETEDGASLVIVWFNRIGDRIYLRRVRRLDEIIEADIQAFARWWLRLLAAPSA